jgi:AraC family transcriptional activator of pyochelin receptor
MQQDQAPIVDQAERFIAISPNMTTLIGPDVADAPRPSDPVMLSVSLPPGPWGLAVDPHPDTPKVCVGEGAVVFLVSRAVIGQLGGAGLLDAGVCGFHLTSELRAIILALRHPPVGAETRAVYRGAKSLEFLCEVIREFRAGALAPTSDGALSSADTFRLLAARQLIADRASEKLTLDLIARSCGVNRSKLSKGFKALFDCTVAQAIAEHRLEIARRMLLTTDLPVSSIGYEAGYRNNASFARAFGRRYGQPPSGVRCRELAA